MGSVTALLLRMSSAEKRMFTQAAEEAGMSRNVFMLLCVEKGLEVSMGSVNEGKKGKGKPKPKPKPGY